MLKKAFVKGFGKTVGVAGFLGLGFVPSLFAFTTPSSGGFLYDMYDIVVNKLIEGPVGTATGVAAMVWGGIRLILGQWGGAVWPILGGAMLVKAEALTESLGMTINNF